MSDDVDEDNDLPLMANADEIRVRHYKLKLEFDFDTHRVKGSAIIFLQPLVARDCQSDFEVILDCRHLDVSSVQEVEVCQPFAKIEDLFLNEKAKWSDRQILFDPWFDSSRTLDTLRFKLEPWCVRVTKASVSTAFDFPRVIRFDWSTRPEGRSLLWRQDQNGSDSLFTPAAAVNNRSLFPCQEPPIAMASWQCVASTKQKNRGIKFFVTGDEDAVISHDEEFYFYTQMVLPMSTFAVAAGRWTVEEIVSRHSNISSDKLGPTVEMPMHSGYKEVQCRKKHDPYPCHIDRGDIGPTIPCRLIGPDNLVHQVRDQWKIYLPACLEAAHSLLGPHPFKKLDIVILPRSYSGLGLSSPSLMFVSQSVVLNCDGYNLIRLAHEVSHSWFGLVVGALDWTEEWLSEGFATFAEDHIHLAAMKILKERRPDRTHFGGYPLADNDSFSWTEWSKCRALIKYKTLAAELEATPEDQQVMRPMSGRELRDPSTEIAYVKNGQNPELAFTQVNYMKGYFLLRHFASIVGLERFFGLLRYYVHELYHGCLVHSTDFLNLFFKSFPDHFPIGDRERNVKKICSEWLDTPRLPNCVIAEFEAAETRTSTSNFMKAVQEAIPDRKRGRKRKMSGRFNSETMSSCLVPEQIILLLEELLECKTVGKSVLKELDEKFSFKNQNADVMHRWCELIVKHNAVEHVPFLESFLREHQAMGIYLYAEMAMKRNVFQKVALAVFESLEKEMDPNTVVNVKSILFEPSDQNK